MTGRSDLAGGRQDAPEQDEDLAPPPELDRRRILRRGLVLVVIALLAVAVIGLVPGLASLRHRFAHANGSWLGAGAILKILSGFSYVIVFRAVFCRRMRWRVSTEIGFSELGANAVLPVGGAGGLALGAWTLRRSGMDPHRIARRSVAFFLLTSVPNVLGVIILGAGLAAGLFGGGVSVALALIPAAIAAGAIILTIAGGRWAALAERRLTERSKPRAAAVMRALAGGVQESLVLLREANPLLIVGLIGYLAFDVMVLWACFHAFGSSPSLAILWFGYLIGELGGLVPIPGGIGGIELGLVGALVLYGVPVGAATAAVLGYRALVLLVPALTGAIAFVLMRRTLAREANAISGCGPGEMVDVIGRGEVHVSGGKVTLS